MSAEGYKTFLENMGHRVVSSGGAYWFNVHPHVYTCFPFDKIMAPDDIKPGEILGRDGWFIRYPCALEKGRPSFRIICNKRDYDLENLSGKARNQTRRGLENCEVRRIEFMELYDLGLKLNRDTLERQGRKLPADFENYWRNYYKNADSADGAESWGAFCDGELAAYLIAFRMDKCSNILIMRSSRDHLNKYPNNALLYVYNKHILTESNMSEVSIGFESIQGDMDKLDHFKKGLGFEQEAVGQRIEASSLIRPFMINPVMKGIVKFAEARGNDEKFSKMAGMLKWYMEQPKLR